MVTETYKVKVQVDGKKQLDNLNNSTLKISKSLGGLGTAAKIAGGAIAALGVTKAIGGFVKAGQEVEELGIRLKLLLGSAEEGGKAFDLMNKFAAKVPFTLESIAASANNLAVVSDNAEHLQQNLEITANIAAAFGMDMQTAGEQIQRALSGGIAAADIFREKGVSAFAGFQQGVSYSAEETAKILQEVFGAGGRGAGAMEEFAGTLTGQVSMIQDAYGRFQKAVASGFFEQLKSQFGDLQKFLQDNEQAINKVGVALGTGLAKAIQGTATAAKFLVENIDLIVAGLSGFFALKVAVKFIEIARSIALVVSATSTLVGLSGVGLAAVAAAVASAAAVYAGLNYAIDGFAESLEENTKALGNNEQAVNGALDSTKKYEEEIKKANEAEKEKLKLQAEQAKAYEENRLNSQKYTDQLKYEQELLDKISQGSIPSMNTELGKFGQIMKDNSKLIDEVNDAFSDTTISVENFAKVFKARFQQLNAEFNPVLDGVNLMINSFQTFKQGVGDAFADAILGAKSFAESIRDVARAIIRQLISGIIQIGLEVFVFDILKRKMEGVRDSQRGLNAELGVELGLRTALAFFTGGGSLFAGFFAEGGKIPAGKFGIVGEEGPELIGGPASVTPLSTPQAQMGATGDVNINFNITTVDADSFDDLLVSRRGTITSIINEGLERQGRTALI